MTTKITEQNISNLANIGVQWQSVFTGDGSTGLTAVAGRGYFIDTTSGTVEVTLPASPSAGDVVVLKDYARTWNTNNVTTASALVDGVASASTFSVKGQTVTLVYMDGTKGWSLINEDTTTSLQPPAYVAATGGTITTSGDFKIHTFTGDGCFVVSCAGNESGSDSVDYLVVAGGGGGASSDVGAGGGAGGYRESSGAASGCYTVSPLGACVPALPVSATTYPVTVGAGGAIRPNNSNCQGNPGSPSVFSTITSTGGGGGGGGPPGTAAGANGGSGGAGSHSGGGGSCLAGSGNTPPTSPPQGNDGGHANNSGAPRYGSGGGGGAGAVGGLGSPTGGGDGGDGVTSSINGTPTTRAGGGGGAVDCGAPNPGAAGLGGAGGGGRSNGAHAPAVSGTANTGGGGGGASGPGGSPNGSGGDSGGGGKGIVIIRYKFQ